MVETIQDCDDPCSICRGCRDDIRDEAYDDGYEEGRRRGLADAGLLDWEREVRDARIGLPRTPADDGKVQLIVMTAAWAVFMELPQAERRERLQAAAYAKAKVLRGKK